MQERTLDDNTKLREILLQKQLESFEAFKARLGSKALEKLYDPKTVSFTSSRIGRNQTCPCGSGKKFKQCCLKKANRGEYKVA